MNVKDNLTLKAAALARTGHAQWSEFLAAFVAYTNSKKNECIVAPVSDVQVVQGRAQQCVLFEELFKGALAAADTITKRMT